MKFALCSICDRQVALGDDDQLTCPVCSSPLIETAEEPDDDPSEPAEKRALKLEQLSDDRESQLLDDLVEWVQRHHRKGGDFSLQAISAAGDAACSALRSGYSLCEAFEAGRTAYFRTLDAATTAGVKAQASTELIQQ